MSDELDDVQRIVELQALLKAATDSEQYEEAARLRDEIHRLRQGKPTKSKPNQFGIISRNHSTPEPPEEPYYYNPTEKDFDEWANIECCSPAFVGCHDPACQEWSMEVNQRIITDELKACIRETEGVVSILRGFLEQAENPPVFTNDDRRVSFWRLMNGMMFDLSPIAMKHSDTAKNLKSLWASSNDVWPSAKVPHIMRLAASLASSGVPVDEAFKEARRIVDANWSSGERS